MTPCAQPPRDASSSSHWTQRRIGAAVANHRSELDLNHADLSTRLGAPAGTVTPIDEGGYDPRLILTPRQETAPAKTPGTIDGDACASAATPQQQESR